MVCLINITKLLITFLNIKLCFAGACVDLGHAQIENIPQRVKVISGKCQSSSVNISP